MQAVPAAIEQAEPAAQWAPEHSAVEPAIVSAEWSTVSAAVVPAVSSTLEISERCSVLRPVGVSVVPAECRAEQATLSATRRATK